MKTYIADIIPKIKKFSEKLDNETLLKKNPWVVIDEISSTKCLYIFRDNGNLIISQNGIVDEGKWEYLGSNRLLIKRRGESFLFNNGFFNENVLALQVEGRDEYAFLVNEIKFNQMELTSFEEINNFLEEMYVKNPIKEFQEKPLEQPEIPETVDEDYMRLFLTIGAVLIIIVLSLILSSFR
jgi:hypothetical protein